MIQWEAASNEINNLLGMLRHSWLKNKIINTDSSFIIGLHSKKTPARKQFEEDIRQYGGFEKKILLFNSLLPSIVDAYSPVHLIDATPLVNLSNKDLELIKNIFQELYLKITNIEYLIQEAEKSIKALNDSFIEFRDLWFLENVDLNVLEEKFQHFQGRASALYDVMKQFPRGIVLP